MNKYLLPLFMLAAFSVETGNMLSFYIYNREFAPELMVAGIVTIDELKRKHPTSLKVVDISEKEIWLDATWSPNHE